jgi:hypothetical protein
MPDNTLTLRLLGEVSLAKFAAAIDSLRVLVGGLAAFRHVRDVRWIIHDLQPGSAMTTIAGFGERVVEVVDAYEEVGDALVRNTIYHYPRRVAKPALRLQSYVGNGVESVAFDTFRRDVVIQAAPPGREVEPEPIRLTGETAPAAPGQAGLALRHLPPAYGAISGQVETIARRGSLRFVLYDTLHDRAVSCYLAEGHEDIMRDAWGHYATVEGLVSRDPGTGRPLSIRQITRVHKRPIRTTSYRDAMGASPYEAVSPEELIKRVRDAW